MQKLIKAIICMVLAIIGVPILIILFSVLLEFGALIVAAPELMIGVILFLLIISIPGIIIGLIIGRDSKK